MSIPQKKLREAVFCALFCHDFDPDIQWEDLTPVLMEQLKMSKKNVEDSIYRATTVYRKIEDIDQMLQEKVQGYAWDRVSSTEKIILRLSAYEMLFDEEIPEVVAIAEGVRLGRKFGTPEGASFINGVLNALYKRDAVIDESILAQLAPIA